MRSVGDMSEGKKFDLVAWLKGGSEAESYEHAGFLLTAVAAVCICIGTLLGSFVKYSVYIAMLGALLLLPAIMLYIASQLMERRNETAPAHKQ